MLLFLTSFCELSKKMKKYNLFFLYFWVVVFTLFRGLRWGTGTDWSQYYACFERADWSNIFTYYRYGLYTELMEYGYVFLNVFVKSIFSHYTFFLLLTNLAILLNFAYFSRKYVPQYPLLTFTLLVVFNPIFPVRQDIAMLFLFWACHFSVCKKYLLSVLFVFIASTIHDMSIIFLPLCFLFNVNVRGKFLCISILCCVIFVNPNTLILLVSSLGELSIGAISEMSTLYIENVTSEPTKMSLFRYLYVLSFILLFKYYYNVRGNHLENFALLSSLNKTTRLKRFSIIAESVREKLQVLNFYTNAYACQFLVYIVAGLGGPLVGCGRIAHFFYPAFPLAFMLTFSLEQSKLFKNVLIGVYVTFFLYQFFRFQIMDLFGLYNDCLNPYYTIFEEIPMQRIEKW